MDFLKDAIAKLSALPDQLEHCATGLSQAQLSWKPSLDVFSVRENILHLRDIDIQGYEQRIRLILTEDCPTLPDVDGGKLARERNYNVQPVQPAIADLRRSRAASMERLAGRSQPDLDRTADMQGIGRIDLRRLLELWMQHDAEHRSDVQELCRAIRTGIPGNHLPNTGLRANSAGFRLL
jgi:hypothetical protein